MKCRIGVQTHFSACGGGKIRYSAQGEADCDDKPPCSRSAEVCPMTFRRGALRAPVLLSRIKYGRAEPSPTKNKSRRPQGPALLISQGDHGIDL
jgi:hypothetical protein